MIKYFIFRYTHLQKGWMKKIGIALLLVVTISTATVLWSKGMIFPKKRELTRYEELTSPQAKKKALSLVEKVSRLVVLPKDEVPTIATVSKVDEIRSQPFYAHAENGDKVLIYNFAKKAYLYRESIDKVIEVAAIDFGFEDNLAEDQAVAGASESAEKLEDGITEQDEYYSTTPTLQPNE